jgi:hypothetical protein
MITSGQVTGLCNSVLADLTAFLVSHETLTALDSKFEPVEVKGLTPEQASAVSHQLGKLQLLKLGKLTEETIRELESMFDDAADRLASKNPNTVSAGRRLWMAAAQIAKKHGLWHVTSQRSEKHGVSPGDWPETDRRA